MIVGAHQHAHPGLQDMLAVREEISLYRLKSYFSSKTYGTGGYRANTSINYYLESSIDDNDVRNAGDLLLAALNEGRFVEEVKQLFTFNVE